MLNISAGPRDHDAEVIASSMIAGALSLAEPASRDGIMTLSRKISRRARAIRAVARRRRMAPHHQPVADWRIVLAPLHDKSRRFCIRNGQACWPLYEDVPGFHQAL